MRPTSAILIATSLLWTCWATAQTQETGLPGATLDDAGQAAGFGQFLCGIPGGQIDAFRQKVDALTSGGTGSAAFHAGEARARKLINQARQENGDGQELRDVSCSEATTLITNTLATP
ncbi:hypothetical protein J2T07_003419 [Luteibacter jiangsuensis]|uniref:HdeA/HdeB family protein n=1 Tax=Luteibacter jiangsuensis TaxID=637577 RepID=A0ABT9T1R6_9GAMM|nr:hypothetical protein [Luteibacter jiangsuensis]MDQ0011209.1 hypothetical protein [Luteibacter jiangsuensis]